MDVEEINEIINAKPNLSTALGMEFISTPEDDTCMARMQVDERNRQPFGFLSGGASLALAENVPSVLAVPVWASRSVAAMSRQWPRATP